MSIDLVFVGSNGPDRLEGELVGSARRGDLLPAVLCAQHHPFALPQGERRDELPRDHAARGGFNVVVAQAGRSEEHTSELQSLAYLVCRLLLEKKKNCLQKSAANFQQEQESDNYIQPSNAEI